MSEATIVLDDPQRVLSLFGPRDQHLRAIRETLGVTVQHRDGEIRVTGEEGAVAKAKDAFAQLNTQFAQSGSIDGDQVTELLARLTGKKLVAPPIDIVNTAKRISPRTAGQARYVQSIREHDITFAVGPAGTGKTYLAVAVAVEALKHHQIKKIVLVRILDEAQNTTVSQMKMFLTRMGLGSKIVISGDTTQVDLPRTSASGLIDALARLHSIEGINIVQLNKSDIVRHKLVQEIVRAYEEEPRGPKKK
ncbi:MAG: PhoH family protein [Planctomycetales bacterium]|nr:PhoH family protein [Planctomycetales bacterium]